MTGAQGTLATPLSDAIVAVMAEHTGRGAPKSRCCVEESVIACVHDNPTKGALSLVRDGKDEAVLAIRRTCQDSISAGLIAIAGRPSARKVAAFMSATTSNPDASRSTRSCSNSKPRRPTLNRAHPDRRPMHGVGLAPASQSANQSEA